MDRPGRVRAAAPLLAAICAVAFVGVVAGIPGSPLQPVQPAGAEPLAPLRWLARVLGLSGLGSTTQASLGIVASVAATAAFLFALWAAWRGELGVRLVTWTSVAFVVFAVLLPLLYSRDVYAYATYGRMASIHHANPYVSVPRDFPHDPLYGLVGPEWRTVTAVYGPAFLLVSAGLTRWLHGAVALIWAYKLLAGAAALGIVLLVSRLSSRMWPSRAAFATVLVGWNPVVLFHDVGGGHNDLLVGLAIVIALWILARGGRPGTAWPPSLGREAAAVAALAVASMVKATAAIPMILVVVAAVWRRRGAERWKAFGVLAGVVAVLVAAFAAPFAQTHDPTFGLSSLAAHEGWLAPTRFFRVVLGHIAHPLGGDAAKTAVQTFVRVALPVVFLVAFVAIAREVGRRASHGDDGVRALATAWGWALLVALLCSPVLWPWYVVWILPLVWLLPRTPRVGTVVISAVLGVSHTVAVAVRFPAIFKGTLFVGHYVLTPVLIVVLVLLLRELRRRVVSGAGLLDELPPARQEHREVAPAGSKA